MRPAIEGFIMDIYGKPTMSIGYITLLLRCVQGPHLSYPLLQDQWELGTHLDQQLLHRLFYYNLLTLIVQNTLVVYLVILQQVTVLGLGWPLISGSHTMRSYNYDY